MTLHVYRCWFRNTCIAAVAIVLSSCATTGPYILSGYGSMQAAARTRVGAHPAIDYGGNVGDPVLSAADGTVWHAAYSPLCGNGIRVAHTDFDRRTLYCHLSEIRIASGEKVQRGQIIGLLGATGEPTSRTAPGGVPIPQLQFELAQDTRPRNDGDLAGSFDPLSITVGCFDKARTYRKDQLVLTHPVACRDAVEK